MRQSSVSVTSLTKQMCQMRAFVCGGGDGCKVRAGENG